MNLSELNESCISVACFTRGMDSPCRGKSSVGFWHSSCAGGTLLPRRQCKGQNLNDRTMMREERNLTFMGNSSFQAAPSSRHSLRGF